MLLRVFNPFMEPSQNRNDGFRRYVRAIVKRCAIDNSIYLLPSQQLIEKVHHFAEDKRVKTCRSSDNNTFFH